MAWSFERVVIVRHGETEWNVVGRRQGQLDSPLTTNGRYHAALVASVVKAIPGIDGVFSSPLGRAVATADVISRRVRLPVRVVQELAEVHHGTFAGLSNQEIDARHPGELKRREAQKYTWRFPEGESYADADKRAFAALHQISLASSSIPILVTHEMIGRMVLRSLLALEPAEALAMSMPHGVVLEVAPARRTIEDVVVGEPRRLHAQSS